MTRNQTGTEQTQEAGKEKKPKSGQKTYLIEIGGEQRELTIDELVEFAQQCASRLDMVNGDLPDLQAFIRQYPEVTEIPPEVESRIREGRSLLDAYREYENSKLRDELSAIKANERNRAQSMDSVRGDARGDAELDELMQVFEAVFK